MTEKLDIPSFEELDQVLAQFGDEVSPVDLHGLLTGLHCGGARLVQDAIANTMQEYFNLDIYMSPELLPLLVRLNDGVELTLQSDSFIFTPLLPEDEDLFSRICLFSRWCENFINGFGATCPEEEKLTEEIEGVLEDLMTFSRLAEEVDPVDQDEESFMELLEYSKVAVLMLYTELVLVPLRKAEQAAKEAEKEIDPERRMPPSNELH